MGKHETETGEGYGSTGRALRHTEQRTFSEFFFSIERNETKLSQYYIKGQAVDKIVYFAQSIPVR
jgi:hypothetical protein